MSNLDNITNKILEDARAQAQRLIADAERQGLRRIEEQTSNARQEAEEMIEKAKEESALIKDRIQTGAEREARDLVLSAKQEVIEKVFARAKKRLAEMSDEDYRKAITRVLRTHKVEGMVLQLPKGRSYEAEGVTVETDPTLESGFRLVTGGIRANYDYAALVDYLRESLEAEVLGIVTER